MARSLNTYRYQRSWRGRPVGPPADLRRDSPPGSPPPDDGDSWCGIILGILIAALVGLAVINWGTIRDFVSDFDTPFQDTSSDTSEAREPARELKVHFDPLPRYAGESAENAVEDVIKSLEGRQDHGAIIRVTNSERDATINVRWVRDYGNHVLGTAIHQTVIYIGLGSTNCYDEWQAFDRDTVVKILYHELGHTLGFGHSDDPNNIMYPATETRFEIERDISRVIAPGWAYTMPLCDEGHYSFNVVAEQSRRGFEFALLSQETTVEDYLLDNSRASGGCNSGQMRRLSDTCDVQSGDKLLFYNNDPNEAITITGQIIQLDDPPWPDMQWDEDAFYYDDATLD